LYGLGKPAKITGTGERDEAPHDQALPEQEGCMRRFQGLALAFGGMMLVAGTARGDEPLTIRIAWTTVAGQMSPILFDRPDLVPHLGKSYRVEHFHFAGSGPMVTAMATGDVDIAPLAPSSFGVAIQNARLDDLKIVTDDYQDGVEGNYSSEFLVLQDSPIKTVDDLKGKVLAVNAVGGGSDIGLRVMLRQHHLEDHRDYSVIETQFPNMPSMLEARKIDLASLVAPYGQRLREAGTARTLFTMHDALGRTQSLANVARAGFLAKNHDALLDFFEDYVHALRWYLDPANREAAVAIVARFNKQPVDGFGYLFTKNDYYRDRDARPDLAAMQRNLQTLKELGFLNRDIDVAAHADLSFIDAAVKRLD
jgi:NitT/TauT family transport system substrate-binding protein